MSSSERPSPTLADFVALAISPALIMGLVGSLVFFLLEVFYRGQYEGRLQWILFFFVFGAVLVARVAMTDIISGRAGLYGLVLGFLTWLGMQFFVDYDDSVKPVAWLINAGLIGLVWWCANKLTWDCTQVDEETDMTGEGVLQAAGLEGESVKPPETGEGTDVELTVVGEKPKGWWQRFQEHRAERKTKRTLGVWVIWFSLAALPLFGLGRSLVGPEELGRRRYLFWLMTVYVGCGLSLLLTTCFLGLRRYLRQRRLRMPAAMTGAWLTGGGTLIVLLLLAGAFLPRPSAEYPVLGLGRLKSQERGASKFAMKNDGSGKGEGRPGENGPQDKDANNSGRGQGQRGDGQGKSDASGGKDGSGKGKQGSGQDRGKQGSSSQQGGKSDKGGDGSKSGKDSRGDSKSGREKAKAGSQQDQGKQGGPGQKDQRDNGGQQAKSGDKQSDGDRSSSSGGSSSPSRLTSALASLSRTLGPVLKWLAFAALAVAVLFVLLRSGLQFLAGFTEWARRLLDALNNFWAGLFGGRRGGKKSEEEQDAEAERAIRSVPFSAFPNPFAGGPAGMAPPELVKYTFAALQAWARERDLGRQPGETALEFAERLGDELPALEADLRRLAALYARAVYARGGLPPNAVELVRQFWERLEAVAEQPLSA
jgi:hypothetical protein